MKCGSSQFATLVLCLALLDTWTLRAAELPRPDEATEYLVPLSMAQVRPRWTSQHRDEGAILGDFLVWPSATLAAVIDSNPFQQRRPGHGAIGARLAPSILAERDTGVQRTLAYAAGDLRFFPVSQGPTPPRAEPASCMTGLCDAT